MNPDAAEWRDEKNIPAQQDQTQAPTRIPCAHGNQGWAPRDQGTPGQGTGSPVGLTAVAGEVRRFARHQRLRNGAEFEHVFAAPRRSSDRFFTVLVRDNAMPHGRLGLAISKKRIRRAVARNRVKRAVRESFRHHAQSLCGLDVVVMARECGVASRSELRHSLLAHWQRLGRLNSPA